MAALVAVAIAKLWPSFLLNPTSALPAFKAAVVREVRSGAQASGALAQRQYRRQRAAAGETSTFRTSLATLPARRATSRRWSRRRWPASRSTTRRGRGSPTPRRGWPRRPRMSCSTPASARSWATSSATEKARGIARIPEPDACWLCRLLATRGAVYKDGSFQNSNTKFTDGALPSSIKVHDNCRCHPEPVFGVYEAPARVREAEATYIAASKAGGGRKAVQVRFRQMVEGRYQPTEN
jgi:hypothetical protein